MARSVIIDVPDAQAMERLGACLAAACQGAVRIYLTGELGAGKTTLVRGFLRLRGHSGSVKSPTFTLLEPYEALEPPVYHFDFYRLSAPEEWQYLGAEDCFGATGQCLVEWPERAGDRLPPPDLKLILFYRPNGREVHLTASTPEGRRVLARLNTNKKE